MKIIQGNFWKGKWNWKRTQKHLVENEQWLLWIDNLSGPPPSTPPPIHDCIWNKACEKAPEVTWGHKSAWHLHLRAGALRTPERSSACEDTDRRWPPAGLLRNWSGHPDLGLSIPQNENYDWVVLPTKSVVSHICSKSILINHTNYFIILNLSRHVVFLAYALCEFRKTRVWWWWMWWSTHFSYR